MTESGDDTVGGDFAIEPLSDRHIPEVLLALAEAHGPGFDDVWFDWKHRRNPLGPSPGWVAVDNRGVIGVRLFLPWRFTDGDLTVSALRPCDTVTRGRARRRGVFAALTTFALDSVAASTDLIFNTPNKSSLPGYLKMGFTPWTSVRQYMGAGFGSSALLDLGASVLPERIGRAGFATDVDRGFLEWRYERIPGVGYEAAALRNSRSPAGVVYRVREWRRNRLLVISESWGEVRELRTLLGSVARHEDTRLTRVTEAGRSALLVRLSGTPTQVTHKILSGRQYPPPLLSLGDIEDVL